MKLTKEEYQALEEIVGPEYITADPVIMESYNQIWGNKLAFGDKRHALRRRWSYRLIPPRSRPSLNTVIKPASCSRLPPGPLSMSPLTWPMSGASFWN